MCHILMLRKANTNQNMNIAKIVQKINTKEVNELKRYD